MTNSTSTDLAGHLDEGTFVNPRLPTARLHVFLSEEGLSSRLLAGLLRGLELLLVFRALSSDEDLARKAKLSYKSQISEELTRTLHDIDARGQVAVEFSDGRLFDVDDIFQSYPGISWSTFERWNRDRCDVDLSLDLLEIRRGSYEFIFQLVNLSAVFVLQDYSVLKDCLQWFCGVANQVIQDRRKSPGAGPILQSRLGTSICLTGDTLQAIAHFDEITLEERHSAEELVFRLSFKRVRPTSHLPLLKPPAKWSALKERQTQEFVAKGKRYRQAKAKQESSSKTTSEDPPVDAGGQKKR